MKRTRRPAGSRPSVWKTPPKRDGDTPRTPVQQIAKPRPTLGSKPPPNIKREHKKAKQNGTGERSDGRSTSPPPPLLPPQKVNPPKRGSVKRGSRSSSIWGGEDGRAPARAARKIRRKMPLPPIKGFDPPQANILEQLGIGEEEEGEKEKEEKEEELEDGQLSSKQEFVVSRVLNGDNVFITGSAGTGKSFVMKEIIQRLNNSDSRGEGVYVTASTGAAAVNIGGCTLHSFAGIGLGNGTVHSLYKRIDKHPRCIAAKRRWLTARVLIIDEVSMLDAGLFDKLEHLARLLRDRSDPFGGIQIVRCGDFFQLPPVRKRTDAEEKKFMFQANCWNKVVHTTFVLDRLFRQEGDRPFAKILNEIRFGCVSPAGERILRQSSVPFVSRPSLEPVKEEGPSTGDKKTDVKVIATMLYPHRKDVDHENAMQLAVLEGEHHSFYARDNGDPTLLKQLQTHCAAPALLHLKLGAQVVLLKNLDFGSGLVNGSRGVIVQFVMSKVTPREEKENIRDRIGSSESVLTRPVAPVVKFTNGVTRCLSQDLWKVKLGSRLATRTQFPLALAWALSIHKAQGMTLSMVKMKLNDVWECGHAYVALSRATSQHGLYLIDYDVRKIRASHVVLRYFREVLKKQAIAFKDM